MSQADGKVPQARCLLHIGDSGYACLLLLIAATFALFEWWVPLQFDDLGFIDVYTRHGNIWGYIDEIRANDNGRLSNILLPATAIGVPRWIWSIFFGCMAAGMFALLERLSRSERIKSGHVSFWLLSLWLVGMAALPWRNAIFVTDYALNYVVPSVAILLLAAFMCSPSMGEKHSCLYFIAALVLAIIAGMLHEGFALPLCSALGILALTRRLKMPLWWWLVSLIFVAAIVWPMTAPGIWARAARESGFLPLGQQIKCLIIYTPLVTILVVYLLGRGFTARGRKQLKTLSQNALWLVAVIFAIISTVMAMMLQPTPRNGWPAELMAMLAWAIILRRSWVNNLLAFRGLRYALTTFVALALCLVMGLSLWWQHRFYAQHCEIMKAMETSRHGTIFYDIIEPQSMPRVLTFDLPVKNTWVEPFHYRCMNATRHPGKIYSLLPKALRDWRPGMGTPAPGNTGYNLYRGLLVSCDTIMEEPDITANGEYVSVTLPDKRYEALIFNKILFMLPDSTLASALLAIWPLPEGTLEAATDISYTEQPRRLPTDPR